MKKLPALALAALLAVLPGCTVGEKTPAEPATGALGLELVPWEGGPEYWKQFAKADAAGWDEPQFFPIVAWYNGVSSQQEVDFDKALGINTYIGMPENFPANGPASTGAASVGTCPRPAHSS